MSTEQQVVIVGVGMVTSVGVSAAETAASVRAATMSLSETDYRDMRFDRVVIGEVPNDALPPLADALERERGITARERRLLQLADRAIRECIAPLGGRRVPLGLCLALPELDTNIALDPAHVLRRLEIQTGGLVSRQGSDASHRGRAGGILGIGQAVLTIEQGITSYMLAGGMDSYRDAYVLATLDLEKRLKSAANYDGFIPGEGAAFLLLANARVAMADGVPAIARISRAAMGFEAGHLHSTTPYRGDGLASTLAQLAQFSVEPVNEVYSSMNGESHWAKEWGVSHLRNRGLFAENHRMHHPADCYGDTGAASGPLMGGLAALGIRNNYRRAPALIYGSSDHGARAAVLVTT